MKKKLILFAAALLMLGAVTAHAENEVVTKTLDIKLEADAKVPSVQNAFLYVAFENQGTGEISDTDIEITYYTKANYMIAKEILKKALPDPIPSGETKKYKLYLGNSVETSYQHSAYPFEQLKSIDHYEVQAVNIRTNLWSKVKDELNPSKP